MEQLFKILIEVVDWEVFRPLLQHQLETRPTKPYAVGLLMHDYLADCGHTLPAVSTVEQARIEDVRSQDPQLPADTVKVFECPSRIHL
ncbi:MAG: hypothetical protein ABSG85_14695, partial [Spirochaetia bacterium]